MYNLHKSFVRYDKYGAELLPGNICVWGSKQGITMYIYVGDVKTGKTGNYGRFYTELGMRSIPYKNIIVAYDPMGSMVVKHDITKNLIRNYYG